MQPVPVLLPVPTAPSGPWGTVPLCSAFVAWGQSSEQGWRHKGLCRALTSCSAQTPCSGVFNVAVFLGMGIRRVLCVPEVTRCARSQARYFSVRPHPSFLLLAQVAPSLLQGCSPHCGCLSQHPRNVLSCCPPGRSSLPAQMEQRCLFSRQAARTSYSHQTRCQLRRLGRHSSPLPGGCGKNSAGSFQMLLEKRRSPIAEPPAEVQGTFLLIRCQPGALPSLCSATGHTQLPLQSGCRDRA